jgi:hypothetical protein
MSCLSRKVKETIIFQSYFYFDKDFKEGISRSSQGSPVQRGSDREDTTHSASGVELKLKYSGWNSSLKTLSIVVLTSNMQHSQKNSVSRQRINDSLRSV